MANEKWSKNEIIFDSVMCIIIIVESKAQTAQWNRIGVCVCVGLAHCGQQVPRTFGSWGEY